MSDSLLKQIMRMNSVVVLMLATHGVVAAEPVESAIRSEILARSSSDWGGGTLPAYAGGQPEVTVARVTIPVGQALPLHEHPYMTAGVVLKGVIEVRTETGRTHVARAGDAVIELVNQPHGGANIGDEEAVILVVYAGIKDQPITVPLGK
jgi:quercetin dioxygenase-like cupin family protein